MGGDVCMTVKPDKFDELDDAYPTISIGDESRDIRILTTPRPDVNRFGKDCFVLTVTDLLTESKMFLELTEYQAKCFKSKLREMSFETQHLPGSCWSLHRVKINGTGNYAYSFVMIEQLKLVGKELTSAL